MSKIPLSEISKVPYYGRSFPFIPWSFTSKVKVSITFAKHLYKTVGLFSFLGFWLMLPFRWSQASRKYSQGVDLMGNSFGWMAKLEWTLLLIIYEELTNSNDEEAAYAFARRAIQDASSFMMDDFYQADRLAKFDDPFEAFWAYHKAMFKDDPNYPNEMIEEENCRTMIVHQCRNCEIAKLTIPGLSPLGCDHDITGYRAIEKKVGMEFRRPQTLAKDGQPCKFMFFREGTVPAGIETK